MALYKGNQKIKEIYFGNQKIKEVYKGSQKVFGEVITWNYYLEVDPISYDINWEYGNLYPSVQSYRKKVINGVETSEKENVDYYVSYSSGLDVTITGEYVGVPKNYDSYIKTYVVDYTQNDSNIAESIIISQSAYVIQDVRLYPIFDNVYNALYIRHDYSSMKLDDGQTIEVYVRCGRYIGTGDYRNDPNAESWESASYSVIVSYRETRVMYYDPDEKWFARIDGISKSSDNCHNYSYDSDDIFYP